MRDSIYDNKGSGAKAQKAIQRMWVALLLLCILCCGTMHAQQVLTIQQAISLAMKNNYDILVAQTDADIAKVNNTWGNAGLLPTIAATAIDNYAYNTINQNYSSGNKINVKGANTNALNTGAFVNWTLFDGGKMFITKKKLNEQEALGVLQYKDKVMATVYDVVTSYYDIVRQQQQLKSLEESIKYNTERVKIFQTRFDAGLVPKTDLLQAKVDLNGYKENVITQLTTIISAKRKLNQLMSRDANEVFDVPDSIPNTYQVNKREIAQKMGSSNTSILAYQKQIDVAKLSIKEFKTLYLPKINITGGYNYARNDNSAGFTLFSQTYGPQAGGSLTIPLYQGGNVKRQVAVAKIQLKAAEYSLERVKLQASIQLQNALTDFDNQQQLYELEKESAVLSKENLDISMARLRLGQTNSLEVRQAELSYQSSLSKLSAIQYSLKTAETRLRQLIADL